MKPPNNHAPFSISQRSDLPSDHHDPWREPRSRKLLIPSLHPLYVPRSICNPKEARRTENQIKNKKATKLNLEGTLTLAFLIILQVGPIHTCQSATLLRGREKQLWEGLLGDSMPQCAKCRIGCRVIHVEAIQDGATCKAWGTAESPLDKTEKNFEISASTQEAGKTTHYKNKLLPNRLFVIRVFDADISKWGVWVL